MIPFIKPFFDENEQYVFDHQIIPEWLPRHPVDKFKETALKHFPNGDILLVDKGEEAIRLAVEDTVSWMRSRPEMTLIAIPSAVCASVYRAVKNFGRIILMDAGDDWNCVEDEESKKADIVLFASLSGKRMDVPERYYQGQILIDDSAQCYDGTSGFRKETDYSIFSFGIGKQMAVGAGGILYSRYKNFGIDQSNIEDWQKYLILSQLSKIKEINRLRVENAIKLIDGLKDLSWLKLPDSENHCFSKFVVFIDHGKRPRFELTWTPEMFRFKEHMNDQEIDIEATYVPLHIRYPDEFQDDRYRNFNVNRIWSEAIALPCRPNLTADEIGQIIETVRAFEPSPLRTAVKNTNQIGRILCVNYQPVSLYEEQGWSKERLAAYYNPENVGEVLIAAFEEIGNQFAENVKAVGFETHREFDQIVADFHPDVIRCYECNQPFAEIALSAARTIGVPSYLSLHDSRKLLDPILSGYTVVTAYTETLAKQAQGVLGRNVEVHRNGVDSTFFDPSKATPVNWILNRYFVVVTSGRNDPVKNIDRMTEALSKFNEKTAVDALMIIIGPGFDQYFSGNTFKYLGKTGQVEIRDILSCADLFFQVQLVPEISMAGTEALMMGVPLINGANEESERLLKYPIGLTVDQPQDVDVLCSYLEFAWANLKELKTASHVRRQFVIDTFDASKMRKQEALRYINLFKESRDRRHP